MDVYQYATITGAGICEGLKQVAVPIEAPPPHYVAIATDVLFVDICGKWYDGEAWHDAPPDPGPVP